MEIKPLEEYDACALYSMLIFLEAENQQIEGMVGVGSVVRNRVLDPGKDWFGDTWKEVMLKEWQFSCFNSDNHERILLAQTLWADRRSVKNKIFEQCRMLACNLMDGRIVDNTKGANHYFNMWTPWPKWSVGQIPTTVIRDHAFFYIRHE